MDYHKRQFIATIVLAAAAGVTYWGFSRMQGEAFSGQVSLFTKVVFFGAAMIGIAAAISRQYWRSKEKSDNGRQAEMDALGAIGRQELEKKHRRSLDQHQ